MSQVMSQVSGFGSGLLGIGLAFRIRVIADR